MKTMMDKSVEFDARRLLCGIQHFHRRTGDWPVGGNVNDMSAYKRAGDKASAVRLLLENGWLKITEESATGHRVKRRYIVTEVGRAALAPPAPRPRIFPDGLVAFPEDEIEYAIYSFHVDFFGRKGRWPNGMERAVCFTGERLRKVSSERRRRAYENLIDEGRLVKVFFWRWKGDSDCYIEPTYSPEYADKHGEIYYAPDLSA
jgi:hypothetical protein